MSIDHGGIKRVVTAFEQGEWDEIHLVTDDVELHLVAAGASRVNEDTSLVSSDQVQVPPERRPDPVSESDAAPTSGAGVGPDTVVAPSPGIFWRAPSPGAPPFVEVGTHVEAGQALCIVEVMKLMNTLSAPAPGTVAQVYAQNGTQVDAGAPLFRIVGEGA